MSLRKSFGALAAVALLGALGACSTTMKAAPLTAGGRFDTTDRMTSAELTIKAPFDRAKFGKMAYVRTANATSVGAPAAPALQRFFFESVTNTKAFDTVYDSEGLQKLVIAKGQTDFNDNLVGLHNLTKQLGPFLLVEPSVEWKGGYNFEATLKVVDPETTDTLFEAKRKAFNWAGLDKPLFYPMFNAFLDWTQGVAPPPAPPKPAR